MPHDVKSAQNEKIATGVRNTSAVADGLADVLIATYRLTIKTHIYHWNVEGPTFFSVHKLTEEQYGDLFAATDELAERIRALGVKAPKRIADITEGSVIGETTDGATAEAMAADLAADHERLAHRMHALVRMADTQEDPATADLATKRAGIHEKAAWMLRAIAA